MILDVEVTTGGVHDSNTLSALDDVPHVTGRAITIATLDAGYGVARVFAELEARGIEAIVPARREPSRKKGLFPPVGSNWMRDTIVFAAREVGILCRTANQMRRASKSIARAFATVAHVRCERHASAQTRSAGRYSRIRIILRYCGLGVGILPGPSVNGLYASHRARVEGVHGEEKTCMGWPGRCGAVSPT